jgi:hypothetical protein
MEISGIATQHPQMTWEYSNITQPQAMKEVCLEDLIKPNQASHQGVG